MMPVHADPLGPPSSSSDDRPVSIAQPAWAPFASPEPQRADNNVVRPDEGGPPLNDDGLFAVGRYVRWGLAFAALVAFWMGLRVQVNQLRVDIETLERQRLELVRDRDQLMLEYAGQRSLPNLEPTIGGLVPAPRRTMREEGP